MNKVDHVRSIYLFGVSLIGVILLITSIIQITYSLTAIYFPLDSKDSISVDLFHFRILYDNIVIFVYGLFIFVFHWFFVVKEGRLGKRTELKYESSMNLFEAIFFYLLAFVGIIVLIFSLPQIVNGFYYIEYPPPVLDKNGGVMVESKPFIRTDTATIIKGVVSSLIGLITFLSGFLRSQFSMKKLENSSLV